LSVIACACGLALPAGALAQDPAAEIPDVALSEPQAVTSGPSFGIAAASQTPQLWATVNICDTSQSPNSMGIRAGMPGNGSGQRMYMRFMAEYWSRALQAWAPVAGSGKSPWVYAGSAELARRQAGWTFAFGEPPAGVTFTMRASVEFEWRAERPRLAKRGIKRHRGRHEKRSGRFFDLKEARVSRLGVVRSVTRMTETGITGVHGGDPAGTSKALCLIY
jgi:hypothetical protein